MSKRNDGLSEMLIALATNAGPFIERARASGMFKQAETVDATPTPTPAASDDGQKAALQEIIVAQAMKIHALEAEVARLSKS
jgi:hypothetical protein